jgi:putative phosphoesterase
MIRAGVLSDTHLTRPDNLFTRQVADCFADCDVIIHAGDLTALPVLEAFRGRTVYAVSGNMCGSEARHRHPERMQFVLGPFVIGLTHGARLGPDTENALLHLFPEADCIIYGHTHQPACHRTGTTLFLNPGTFRSPGTFAVLEAGETLTARIVAVPFAQ